MEPGVTSRCICSAVHKPDHGPNVDRRQKARKCGRQTWHCPNETLTDAVAPAVPWGAGASAEGVSEGEGVLGGVEGGDRGRGEGDCGGLVSGASDGETASGAGLGGQPSPLSWHAPLIPGGAGGVGGRFLPSCFASARHRQQLNTASDVP